ncbi:type I secretion C-terminal target domain-containing protein [Vogesella indigofera]|uniref:type I secretion C-terminal target domain-containing protein n=1 Tax=Vogesella indigofera TaxID=45465 RepID=UPI00234F3838|nr:type I secretion C-terminal target domain-containing protein [Vogesella indigofera]MDC7712059.1 type I secretion C-terminal target domain-containing protein [Vogesella indigofera]
MATLTGTGSNSAFEKIDISSTKGAASSAVTDESTPGVEDTVLLSLSGPGSVVEGEITAKYRVSMSQKAETEVTITLNYSGTAADGSDYTKQVEVKILAGADHAEFDLTTLDDALEEGDEKIVVTLGQTTGGGFEAIAVNPAQSSVTTTIVDNDHYTSLDAVVEGSSGNALQLPAGVSFTGQTALGGTVSLVNGQYLYQAPVRDHADAVSDVDSFSYTTAAGITEYFTIALSDTAPVANNDTGNVAVGINVVTDSTTSLLVNDTILDSSQADPGVVYSVAGANGTSVVLAGASVTVAGLYGNLTVNVDGTYRYVSTLDTSVRAAEGSTAVKAAFDMYGYENNSLPKSGTSLNLSGLTSAAQSLVDVRASGSNSKPGIGVTQGGGGTNDIGGGESLVVALKTNSNFVSIGINELNSGQSPATWSVYDAEGKFVASGSFASTSSSGALQTFNIATADSFKYVVLGYAGSNNGYVIDSLSYEPAIGEVTETFTYVVKDNDGTQSNTATLTLNGGTATVVQPASLSGVEDQPLLLSWSAFGVSDTLTSITFNALQGEGELQYQDSSGQWQTVNGSKSFTKADFDSGKLQFVSKDNASGADVYDKSALGNKGKHYAELSFDVEKGGKTIVEDKKITVDILADADKPVLSLGNFHSLASINFEDVNLGGKAWRDDVLLNGVEGAGTIGQWQTLNSQGKVEVGYESVYFGGSSSNKVMEIEAHSGDKTLFTDIDCKADRFYQLSFDIAGRKDYLSSSELTIKLVKLNDLGSPVSGSEQVLYRFNPTTSAWLRDEKAALNIATDGKYRLIFEGDNGDTFGALLDNIRFQAMDNRGYVENFIKLSEINAALQDTDGSESLTVRIEGLVAGAVIKDAAGHSVTLTATDKGIVDVSGWNLQTLSVKAPAAGAYELKIVAESQEKDSAGMVLDRESSEVSLTLEVLDAKTVLGTDKNDTLNGTAEVDVLLAGNSGSMSIDDILGSSVMTSDSESISTGNADIVKSGSGNDRLYGQGGSDILIGQDGDDYLHGGSGSDGLSGGNGNDVLIGGSGADALRGGASIDTFRWELGDKGDAGTPVRDTIMDFKVGRDGDVLDLRDLLQAENSTNLESYLHFSINGSNDTLIQISSAGSFKNGNHAAVADQEILLKNVAYDSLVSGAENDLKIITELLKNNLKTD